MGLAWSNRALQSFTSEALRVHSTIMTDGGLLVQYLAIGIRCLIGAVFLASAISKIAGRGAFRAWETSVRDMRLLPPNQARVAALFVFTLEFAVCVLLASPFEYLAVVGFVVAAGLLAVFLVAIVLTVRHGSRVSCRCFGMSTVPLGRMHVVRNIALAVAAVAGGLTTLAGGPVHLSGVPVAVVVGLVFGALVAALDDIVHLFQPVGMTSGAARGLH